MNTRLPKWATIPVLVNGKPGHAIHDEENIQIGVFHNRKQGTLAAASPEMLRLLDELLATHELREQRGETITPLQRRAMDQALELIARVS